MSEKSRQVRPWTSAQRQAVKILHRKRGRPVGRDYEKTDYERMIKAIKSGDHPEFFTPYFANDKAFQPKNIGYLQDFARLLQEYRSQRDLEHKGVPFERQLADPASAVIISNWEWLIDQGPECKIGMKHLTYASIATYLEKKEVIMSRKQAGNSPISEDQVKMRIRFLKLDKDREKRGSHEIVFNRNGSLTFHEVSRGRPRKV